MFRAGDSRAFPSLTSPRNWKFRVTQEAVVTWGQGGAWNQVVTSILDQQPLKT